jgi:3-hydroxybutyryl-CoA dehydrogenase
VLPRGFFIFFYIAVIGALAGYPVTIAGRTQSSVKRGRARFRKNFESLVRADIYRDQEAKEVDSPDFVYEAVLENLEIKQRLFGEIERFCSEHTLMASSTSGLSHSDINSLMKAPERMLVMHFWNPPYLVPLVEVVAGSRTGPKEIWMR